MNEHLNEGDGLIVQWWWTPDCGYLHLEEGVGMTMTLTCPEGVYADSPGPTFKGEAE